MQFIYFITSPNLFALVLKKSNNICKVLRDNVMQASLEDSGGDSGAEGFPFEDSDDERKEMEKDPVYKTFKEDLDKKTQALIDLIPYQIDWEEYVKSLKEKASQKDVQKVQQYAENAEKKAKEDLAQMVECQKKELKELMETLTTKKNLDREQEFQKMLELVDDEEEDKKKDLEGEKKNEIEALNLLEENAAKLQLTESNAKMIELTKKFEAKIAFWENETSAANCKWESLACGIWLEAAEQTSERHYLWTDSAKKPPGPVLRSEFDEIRKKSLENKKKKSVLAQTKAPEEPAILNKDIGSVVKQADPEATKMQPAAKEVVPAETKAPLKIVTKPSTKIASVSLDKRAPAVNKERVNLIPETVAKVPDIIPKPCHNFSKPAAKAPATFKDAASASAKPLLFGARAPFVPGAQQVSFLAFGTSAGGTCAGGTSAGGTSAGGTSAFGRSAFGIDTPGKPSYAARQDPLAPVPVLQRTSHPALKQAVIGVGVDAGKQPDSDNGKEAAVIPSPFSSVSTSKYDPNKFKQFAEKDANDLVTCNKQDLTLCLEALLKKIESTKNAVKSFKVLLLNTLFAFAISMDLTPKSLSDRLENNMAVNGIDDHWIGCEAEYKEFVLQTIGRVKDKFEADATLAPKNPFPLSMDKYKHEVTGKLHQTISVNNSLIMSAAEYILYFQTLLEGFKGMNDEFAVIASETMYIALDKFSLTLSTKQSMDNAQIVVLIKMANVMVDDISNLSTKAMKPVYTGVKARQTHCTYYLLYSRKCFVQMGEKAGVDKMNSRARINELHAKYQKEGSSIAKLAKDKLNSEIK